MTNEYNIILTSKKAHAVETGIVLSQGDFGAVLKITVEGLDTSNTSCQIAFRKVAGSVEATGLTASGGVYSYALRGTELDQPGKVIADLKFREGTSKRISTASFIFEVTADTLDGLSEEAHSYSDSILQMRQQIVEEARADLAPVQYVQQSLTDAQKAQARANIGVASGLVYKGTVATTAQLPPTGNQPGDFYVVSANNHAYAWDGSTWRDNGAASGMQDYSGLVGDAWSSSKTYTVGDYAIYNNNLYKAKLQNSNVTPTNTTYWTHVSVANEVSLLNRDLTNIKFSERTSPHIASGYFEAYSNKTLGMCHLYLDFSLNGASNGELITTLPVEFRPNRNKWIYVNGRKGSSDPVSIRGLILENGDFKLYDIDNSTWAIQGMGVYFVT